VTTALTVVQVQRIYIKASAEAVWSAITRPEWSERCGFSGAVEYQLQPGGRFAAYANEGMLAKGAPEVAVEGEVIAADPPHRLVQTWRVLMDPSMAAEAPSQVTWEIEERAGGLTRLTVTHELPEGSAVAGLMAGSLEEMGAGGGWAWILSGLKTVLETGERMESVR
jgi:uncharacterized protein YndB with AHSA1/START domain